MEKNLLLVKYSDGRIMVGNKDDSEYTRWVFQVNEFDRVDIVDTMLINNKEARQILTAHQVIQDNKELFKKLSDFDQ